MLSPARGEFAAPPFSWQWQREVMARLQPRDACRFAATCKDIFQQKADIAALYRADHPFQCAICGCVVRYPHRLRDCGHIACGMCIYDQTYPRDDGAFQQWCCSQPSGDWRRSCGVPVRNRPEKLGEEYATQEVLDAAAASEFPIADQRRIWNMWHRRPCKGVGEGFGGDSDVFRHFLFPGDFDDKPSVDYRDLAHMLPVLPTGAEWKLFVYYASWRFSGPDIISGLRREDATAHITRVATRHEAYDMVQEIGPDDVLRVKEWREDSQSFGFECVLNGWQHLIGGRGLRAPGNRAEGGAMAWIRGVQTLPRED